MTTSETTTRTGVLEIETRIEATPDVVFRYLTQPQLIARWGGTDADIDPRPGGVYRETLGPGHVAAGEYVEVVENERLSYTFGWDVEEHPIPAGSSLVEIDLVPDGDATLVRLRHSGLPEDAVGDHTAGWTQYHERLGIAATGGDPGPNPMVEGSSG